MMQRDYMLNEARKMALLLAKLMGLKADGNDEIYLSYFNTLLQDEYHVELKKLLRLNEAGFIDILKKGNYSTEKLNMLSQMLYLFAEPFKVNESTENLLKKVLIIFDLLETEHHYDSFDNFSKRTNIYKYFK